jgi:hypothetical protein
MYTDSQQKQLLKNRNIHDTKPKRQFTIDFIEQFQEKCLNVNEYTLLLIDANESLRFPELGGMPELIKVCGLIPRISLRHRGISNSREWK